MKPPRARLLALAVVLVCTIGLAARPAYADRAVGSAPALGSASRATAAAGTWTALDKNDEIGEIAVDGGNVYQVHDGDNIADGVYSGDGTIWKYTGQPCSVAGTQYTCTGWQLLDNNSWSGGLAAGGGNLYQIHGNDASIWKYTGQPCVNNGTTPTCSGWQQLDNNPRSNTLVADGSVLYQWHTDGSIWTYTGQPCISANGLSCAGWQLEIDGNVAAAGGNLYQFHRDGSIWKYTGQPCVNSETTLTCWRLAATRRATLQPSRYPPTVLPSIRATPTGASGSPPASPASAAPTVSAAPAGSSWTTTRTPVTLLPLEAISTSSTATTPSGRIPVNPATSRLPGLVGKPGHAGRRPGCSGSSEFERAYVLSLNKILWVRSP